MFSHHDTEPGTEGHVRVSCGEEEVQEETSQEQPENLCFRWSGQGGWEPFYPFTKGTAQSFLSWKIKLFTSEESKARN